MEAVESAGTGADSFAFGSGFKCWGQLGSSFAVATVEVVTAVEPSFKCSVELAVLVASGLNCLKHYLKDYYPFALLHLLEEQGFVDFHWHHFERA